MQRRRGKFSVLCLLFAAAGWFLFAPSLRANLLSGLSAAQIQQVESGVAVYTGQDVGKPWPRAVVYRWVKATPQEVMAVFTDYESAPMFIPNVVSTRVVREVAPWEKEVAYQLTVPLLPNEAYVATNVLKKCAAGKGLEVSWKVGQAKYFRSSEGNLCVQSHRGGSLLRYTNLVDPGSRFASLLRSAAQKQIVQTVNAIANRVSSMQKNSPEQLAQKVKDLDAVLAGMPTSQDCGN